MIISYKLCISIFLEPVKVDIKRTQTKKLNIPIINIKRFKRSFSLVLFYMQLYTK